MQIDTKDKMILSLLARNPHLPQSEIANGIGLSQPSVAVRIDKLKKSQIMQTQIGINPMELGLIIAKVDVTTDDPTYIFDMFTHCPYFINGYTVSGEYNLCLFFISDNVKALEALVNCHIRSSAKVKHVDFNLITDAKKNFIVPVKFFDENIDSPPCGVNNLCDDCRYHLLNSCMGCPATSVIQS